MPQLPHADQADEAKPAKASGASRAGATRGIFSATIRSTPTLLVFVVLAAVGYWGHSAGWKVPAFSTLTGAGPAKSDDWCSAHAVPGPICVACNARLMPKAKLHGWCEVHGVAECILEHPELAQFPETPTISHQDLARSRRGLETLDRPANDPQCKMHLRRIQFATSAAADKAGIEVATVERGPIVEAIQANGVVQYDPTRVTRLSSRVAGTVWSVEKSVGDDVQQGEVLALVEAVAVGQAKAELLRAAAQLDLKEKTLKRLTGLDGVMAGKRLQEAETALADAVTMVRKAAHTLSALGLPIELARVQNRSGDELAKDLQFLGLPSQIAARLDVEPTVANLLPVIAPRSGVVVARDIVAGEVIDTAKTVFTVVDTSRMWLMLDVPMETVRFVAPGQKVSFLPDGGQDSFEGRVTWLSTDVDTKTRTVRVRAELPNDGQLRNENFGAGQIVLREESDAILASEDAIHWEGCCHVAFVRDKDFVKEESYKVFHTRMVRPGVTSGGSIELLAGLLPGEVVATRGSGVLRAELLKGNLGAG